MVRTFGTWEEAAIYASYMRSEGYFAEMLDMGASSLYGPAAIGGIRVLVSDEPVTAATDGKTEEVSESEVPPPPAKESELERFLRIFVVGIVVLSLAIIVREWFFIARESVGGVLAQLYFIAEFLFLQAVVWLLLVLVMERITRSIRSEQRKGMTGVLFWLVVLVMLPAVMLWY